MEEAESKVAKVTAKAKEESEAKSVVVKDEPVKEDKPVASTSSSFTNPYAQLNESTVKAEVKAQAEKDFPDDYMTQDYAVQEQIKSFRYLRDYNITSEVEETQMQKAMNDFPNDYMTAQYAFEEQMKAYKN